MHLNPSYRIGDVTITRIDELPLNGTLPSRLYPKLDPRLIEENRDWLTPGDLDPASGHLIQSIHSWLVRTRHHTILIDTAAGNDKLRPLNPLFHQLNTPWLQRLAAAGIQPEQVDYVLQTHLHVDHSGWNTRLIDGRWVPTFPQARYVFPQREEEWYASKDSHNEVNIPNRGVFEDSVAPIIATGQAERIGPDGGDFLDNFQFIPTPGHSIGHMSIALQSQGEQALFSGDIMHHPLQILAPDLNTLYCEWPEQAQSSRQRMLTWATERDALVFTSHFARSSAGRVSRQGTIFNWQYA